MNSETEGYLPRQDVRVLLLGWLVMKIGSAGVHLCDDGNGKANDFDKPLTHMAQCLRPFLG